MGIRFTGPFAPMCEQFVAQKRAFDIDYTQQEKLLHMFDTFSKTYPVEPFIIDEALALAWCQKRPNEADLTRYNRIMEMQRFARFLIDQGYPSYLINFRPAKNSTHTPYIFTKEEIHRIFKTVDVLKPCTSVPYRHLVMPILLRLLYGCGLRISETLALRVADIDLENGVLHIRHGKNGRERLVPHVPVSDKTMRFIRAECSYWEESRCLLLFPHGESAVQPFWHRKGISRVSLGRRDTLSWKRSRSQCA